MLGLQDYCLRDSRRGKNENRQNDPAEHERYHSRTWRSSSKEMTKTAATTQNSNSKKQGADHPVLLRPYISLTNSDLLLYCIQIILSINQHDSHENHKNHFRIHAAFRTQAG